MDKKRIVDSSVIDKLPSPHAVYVKMNVDSTELDAAIEKAERLLAILTKAAEIMSQSATKVDPDKMKRAEPKQCRIWDCQYLTFDGDCVFPAGLCAREKDGGT